MNERDFVTRMTLPMRQAAAAVRWLEGRVPNKPKADEDSLAKSALTDADCVSQEILLAALVEVAPEVELDAEEDTPLAHEFERNRSEYRVRIDPIDGTLRYVSGDGLYAIILGVERNNEVVAALISVPQEDVLVRAVRGQGAEISRRRAAFQAARVNADGNRVLVSHGVSDAALAAIRAEGAETQLAAGGAIGLAPLLKGTTAGLRISAKPKGVSPRGWVAAFVAREAGARACGLDAELPPRFEPGVEGLIIASDQARAEQMREKLL